MDAFHSFSFLMSGSTWMECDDLKSVITRYHHTMPAIPPGQVHMVMWERRLTPAHELQMRDTEDTRVLASLVLTVQQPSTHQTSDPGNKKNHHFFLFTFNIPLIVLSHFAFKGKLRIIFNLHSH